MQKMRFIFRFSILLLLITFQFSACKIFHRVPEIPLSVDAAVMAIDKDMDGVPAKFDSIPYLEADKDTDGDGVADKFDKCPDVAGLAENYGCPLVGSVIEMERNSKDTDHDGIIDQLDKCPDVFGVAKNHGCPGSENTTGGNQETTARSIQASDTISNYERIRAKSASLAYCFHKEMYKGDTQDLFVTLGINRSKSFVIKKIRADEAEQMELIEKYDSCEVHAIEINVYEYLTITILYDRSDFKIQAIKTSEKQKIDTTDGNSWHWMLTAISEKPSATITLVIDGVKPNGEKCQFPNKTIPIKIRIKADNVFRRFIDYLSEHPEYTVPSIIVPLVGVLFTLWRERKKKRKKKSTG